MLIGLAGVGKSTWAKKFKEKYPNTDIISSDKIRKELYGDESVQDNPQKVFEIAHNRIIKSIDDGAQYTIFDATNIKRKNRLTLMDKLKKYNIEKEYVIFAEPLDVILLQNKKRERNVPEEIILKMMKQFETPLPYEGYTRISLINKHQLDLHELRVQMECFEQHNSHHTLKLFEHCMKSSEYVKQHEKNILEIGLVHYAALWHDVGKLYTQTFFNKKGRETEDAHYYYHENIGGYFGLMLPYNLTVEEQIFISQCICYHMLPYSLQTEESKVRWRKRCGEEIFNAIMLLHEADEAAH